MDKEQHFNNKRKQNEKQRQRKKYTLRVNPNFILI